MDFGQRVRRAVAVTEELNALRYEQTEEIRAAWTRLTGQEVDSSFHLIPPVYSHHGTNIRVGRDVFVNQGCRFDDVERIELGDEVMLGPAVSLLTGGHPVDPARRRRSVTSAPITLGRNVWIGAGAIVLQGVTVGDDSVVAAGAVVTRDVRAGVLVAGVPAREVRPVV